MPERELRVERAANEPPYERQQSKQGACGNQAAADTALRASNSAPHLNSHLREREIENRHGNTVRTTSKRL